MKLLSIRRRSWLILFVTAAAIDLATAEKERISFNQDVRPILSDHCFACHGFDEKERKADLRLDIPEGAFGNLGNGIRPVVPGELEASEVWWRVITDDEDELMPPPDFHKPLTAAEKDILKRWIEEGAEFQGHWSFLAPDKPEVPDGTETTNPIDAFLLDRLQREKLTMAPPADRATLIRRITLDLTGLPPTPEEVDAFLADRSERAYETLVDGLLARSTFGENQARFWLDLVRYADTHGLHLDNERSMWPYRDWVVRAFNENIPFDDFTRWQLAGDLLPKPTRDQLIASGFNRCNVSTSEGGSIAEEWIYRYAVDRTTTAVEIWMGLTAGCAVCHDHKFDPLSTEDYYGMYAFFHSAADPAMDGNKIDTPPILRLTSAEDQKRLDTLGAEISAVDQKIATAVAGFDYSDPADQDPPPPPSTVETIWFEDAFPPGTKPRGSSPNYVTKETGEVFSGAAALKRTAVNEIGQDYFDGAAIYKIPKNGKLSVHCFLDPEDVPKTIMLQFHVNGGWNHRAYWGNGENIDWGEEGSPSKTKLGALPKAGEWVKLEFDTEAIGLKPGMKVDGYAFTLFDGTVTWDRLSVTSTTNPVTDPTWSWSLWKEQNQGKRNNELPEGLRQLVRGKRADQWTEAEAREIQSFWMANFYAGARDLIDPLESEKAPLEAEKEKIEKNIPITFIMADLPTPRESFVMERGQYDNPGKAVSRSVPSFLPPLPPKREGKPDYDRLDLANWLVSGTHPLTARVTVNRFWQQFFGTGLVGTSADFGSQGEPPSHPELLDWLAVCFVEDGWDTKQLIRRIVTSRAYRQQSRVAPPLLEKDPKNRLLARGPRLRLDAEVLRDQALSLSGLLVPTIGGKGVKPYQPPNIWEPVGFGSSNTRYYKQDTGDALYRRSLYTFLKRTAPPPFMTSFDAPNREQSCSARGRSNTPMQALQLMNDIQHVEAARNFAQRILTEGGETDEARLRWAWRAATARWPAEDEIEIVVNALAQHRNRFASDPEATAALVAFGESPVDPALPEAELAAHTLVANLLLNLDEVVTKN